MNLAALRAKLRPGEGPAESSAVPPEAPPRSIVDPRGFLALIEMMREHHRYDFADETLRGIYDAVDRSGHVTESQHAAILRIRHSVKNWEDLEDP